MDSCRVLIVFPICELRFELIRLLGFATGCSALLEELIFAIVFLPEMLLFRDRKSFVMLVVSLLNTEFERKELLELKLRLFEPKE